MILREAVFVAGLGVIMVLLGSENSPQKLLATTKKNLLDGGIVTLAVVDVPITFITCQLVTEFVMLSVQ